jgi:pimeloyl-ACP methyl ester carboxylesterase
MTPTRSKDGTPITFELIGEGPPLILVMGAFNDRTTGAALAAYLSTTFTVVSYDRRGRGKSGDTAPDAVEREIEDLEAVIRSAGGSAGVFGFSSGAALALEAGASCAAIEQLALYELPPAQPPAHAAALAALIAEDRRGDAVEYFQARVVGIPEHVVAELRHAPFRPALEAMAPTLVYDATIVSEGRLSPDLLAKVRKPTLAIAGSASPPFMRQIAETIARALPSGKSVIIDGATHDLSPELLGPVLKEFFGSARS